jgi:hypothetical protein
MLIVLVILVAVVVIASLHFDGALRPQSPAIAVLIAGSSGWYVHPQIVASDADADAVYVVAAALPHGDRFDAVRIDVANGTQSTTTVTLGPGSPFRPFVPAPVRADVLGVRFPRPVLHLMSLPDGRGPGVHAVDSATGRIAIVLDDDGAQRQLFTRSAFNSSTAAETISLISADQGGRWIAALSRSPGGWTLFLFPRSAASRRAEIHSEEL